MVQKVWRRVQCVPRVSAANMATLPSQKKRQQILLAVLIVVIVLILITWFFGFRALRPSSPSQGAPAENVVGEEQPLFLAPRLDWDFISSFQDFQETGIFSAGVPTSGRENPFVPY